MTKLEINGERKIPAPQDAVWTALNDPVVLRECIPGCDLMEKVSDTEYRLGMLAVVGPVKARFSGKLILSDIVEPRSYALTFEGSGGAAGFGKGSAQVTLSSLGAMETQLDYKASAQVGGKIAQVGSRLIDGIARKIAEDFFKRFDAIVTAAQTEADGAASTSTNDAGDAGATSEANSIKNADESPSPASVQAATVTPIGATASPARQAGPTVAQRTAAAPPAPRRTFGWSSIIIVIVVVALALALLHLQK